MPRSAQRWIQDLESDIRRDVEKCKRALLDCHKAGLFEEVGRLGGNRAFKLCAWKGDVSLGAAMSLHVSKRWKTDGKKLQFTERDCVAPQSASIAALSQLCKDVQLPATLGFRETLNSKQCSDLMEAVIFRLGEVQEEARNRDHSRKASTAMDLLRDALFRIGCRRSVREPLRAYPGEVLRQHRAWLGSFAAKDRDEPYTHSSLFGGRDWVTDTGRLLFPDTAEVYDKLNEAVVALHKANKPLCWVEMATQRYPFYEDIDVMGASTGAPPSNILDADFWSLRAQVLHKIYPSLKTIELTLFTAHGLQKEKELFKASYHAVWNNIIVDKGRAACIRLNTIKEFDKESSSNGRMAETKRRLLAANEKNVWEAVFDQASVFGGSFRMPFCDKVHRGRLEQRRVLPEAVWRFTFGEAGRITRDHVHGQDGLSELAWAQRGRVRLVPDPATAQLPPLTEWQFPKDIFMQPQLACGPRAGGSGGGSGERLRERTRLREQQVAELWEQTQRLRRRRWLGQPLEFKSRADAFMGDEDGFESTWMEIKAKAGFRRWLWASKRQKGAIEIEDPGGQVFIRGSEQNQVVLLDLLRQFTAEWDGPIPKFKGKVKSNLLGKGKGKKGLQKGSSQKGGQGGFGRSRWMMPRLYSGGRK